MLSLMKWARKDGLSTRIEQESKEMVRSVVLLFSEKKGWLGEDGREKARKDREERVNVMDLGKCRKARRTGSTGSFVEEGV